MSCNPPQHQGPSCGHNDALVVFTVEGQGELCSRCWRRWVAGNIGWPESGDDAADHHQDDTKFNNKETNR